MLISHKNKFIFIKSSKSAGTSLELYFEPCCFADGADIPKKSKKIHEDEHGIVGVRGRISEMNERPKWYNHQNATEVKEMIGPEIWDSYFKFSSVRNPFARAVSQFLFRRRVRKAPPADFDTLFKGFGKFLTSGNGRTYEDFLAIDGENAMDDIIRFENVAADANRIREKLDCGSIQGAFPHVKKADEASNGRPVADFFDKDRVDALLEIESWTFENFGYDRDPTAAGMVGASSMGS